MPRTPLKTAIIDLLVSGVASGEISRRLGCSAGAVSYHARALGIPPSRTVVQSRAAVAAIDWEAVAYLASEGWSHARIGTHFNVGRSTISNGMHARGIASIHRNGRKRAEARA